MKNNKFTNFSKDYDEPEENDSQSGYDYENFCTDSDLKLLVTIKRWTGYNAFAIDGECIKTALDF